MEDQMESLCPHLAAKFIYLFIGEFKDLQMLEKPGLCNRSVMQIAFPSLGNLVEVTF